LEVVVKKSQQMNTPQLVEDHKEVQDLEVHSALVQLEVVKQSPINIKQFKVDHQDSDLADNHHTVAEVIVVALMDVLANKQ